mmetsp:Transcript_2052/g.3696  ORF Transcript_2052/g.3696 Transcript_2052/m.3696 type:complete len:701 (-) Transcript_2052:253-2355(-)
MGKGKHGTEGASAAAAAAGTVDKNALRTVTVKTESGIRTCPWYDPKTMPLFDNKPVNSVFEMFQLGASYNKAKDCLGWRQPKKPTPVTEKPEELGDYQYISYEKTEKLCVQLGTALINSGLKKGDFVGIYSRNNPSWMVASYGAASQGIVTVPIYDSFGPDIAEYIINHSEIKLIFAEAKNMDVLMSIWPKCPTLKQIVLINMFQIDEPLMEEHSLVKEGKIISFTKFLEKGTEDLDKVDKSVNAEDLFVVMYTSGTTGMPKGVMLKHKAFLESVGGALIFFEHHGTKLLYSDVAFSYLPLAHIFAQQCDSVMYAIGATVCFSQGDIKNVLDDMMAAKPTLFIGVPRVFARFQQRIQDSINSSGFLKKLIFGLAWNRQIGNVENLRDNAGLWDGLVFSKVRERLLPRVRLVVSGSAPLSPSTNDFLKVMLNCPVVQGFGMSETTGGAICSALRSKSGTCGGPLPNVEVKLVDVPEMNYRATNDPPQGELWIRGGMISHGYYKNEQASAESHMGDGWLATGDIAQFNDDDSVSPDGGSISIIDRKKNLFKLSQGEYVSPETLEQEYAKAALVAQVWVYGNPSEDCLVAIIVPDMVEAKRWAESKGQKDIAKDLKAVSELPDFKKDVLSQLLEIQKSNKFKGYEVIKDCSFETQVNELGQGFTVENDLLTPSFKVKRPQMKKKYEAQIKDMYEKQKAAASKK